eukprot:jgi/Ulvmu1/6681/UM030_0012.1
MRPAHWTPETTRSSDIHVLGLFTQLGQVLIFSVVRIPRGLQPVFGIECCSYHSNLLLAEAKLLFVCCGCRWFGLVQVSRLAGRSLFNSGTFSMCLTVDASVSRCSGAPDVNMQS